MAKKYKFDIGRIVVTPIIDARMDSDRHFLTFVQNSLTKFRNCDWGNLSEEDKDYNNGNVEVGNGSLLGSYKYSFDGTRISIITEGDRSVTTIKEEISNVKR